MLFNSRFEKKRNSEKLFAILKSLLLCLFDTLFKQEFVVPFFSCGVCSYQLTKGNKSGRLNS